ARHVRLVTAVADDRLEPFPVGEERARRDLGPVVALSLQAVALRAHAHPLGAPELLRRLRGEPALVVGARLDDHAGLHRGVEDPAEPAALAAVGADSGRLEPGVVRLAGDG